MNKPNPQGPASTGASSQDILERLADVIEQRRAADPDKSYVARLFHKGPDAILKKVGEEATEAVMAAKDGDPGRIVVGGPRDEPRAERAPEAPDPPEECHGGGGAGVPSGCISPATSCTWMPSEWPRPCGQKARVTPSSIALSALPSYSPCCTRISAR